MLGCGCGAALISVFHKNVKVAWKTVTGGVAVGVGAMSPSAIMELFGTALDTIAIFKYFLVDSQDADTPGKELIDIALGLKCFRLAANGLHMLAAKLGMDNPVAEQVVQCIDLISVLVNFSLYTAVYAKQLDATSWKGHDEGMLVTAGIDDFLETLATIGYFTASTLKDKNPPAGLVGLACCQNAALAGMATKGVNFSSEYKKL